MQATEETYGQHPLQQPHHENSRQVAAGSEKKAEESECVCSLWSSSK
jgi:hypothetical protein